MSIAPNLEIELFPIRCPFLFLYVKGRVEKLVEKFVCRARLVVGTSHGVYVGTRSTEHLQPSGGSCPWSFELNNEGLLRGNSSLSPSHEQFLHPVSVLGSSGSTVFVGIGVTIGRGPARPRAGDPFSVYAARWDLNARPGPWTGILVFRESVAIFSIAVSARTGQLLVATDRGVFATTLVDPGAIWLELGVAPAMVSTSRGLGWQPCGSGGGGRTRPIDAMPCPPPFEAHNTRACSGHSCLPITTQMNYTHPNARTVALGKSGTIIITLWDEGWAPCSSPERRYLRDPTLRWFKGGPFKSLDGGVTFQSLFRSPSNQSAAIFSGATLRCRGQPSKYLTSNWPHAHIDPANDDHVLLAGWGFGGQGLYELGFVPGEWTEWASCNSTIDPAGCFAGDRVDSLALDSNQYTIDFRIVDWHSNESVVISHGNVTQLRRHGPRPRSPLHERSGAAKQLRPEVLMTDSRGALHGVWDPVHHRFGFLHLNDAYAGTDNVTRLPQWHTTGLGDTCVNDAVFTPGGPLLLAVADGGVARTSDGGVTWTRPSELWPGSLAASSNSEALLYDPGSGCVTATHWGRGSNELGSILSSCDDGMSWTVLGGWDGASIANKLTPLNGSMAHKIAFDHRSEKHLFRRPVHTSGASPQRPFFVTSSAGVIFAGPTPGPGGSLEWVQLKAPAAAQIVAGDSPILTNFLATTEFAPDLLFLGRSDGLWVGTLRPAPDFIGSWVRLPIAQATAVAFLPGPAKNVTLLIGTGPDEYGARAAIYRCNLATNFPGTVSISLRYRLQADAPSWVSPDQLAALGRMSISSLFVLPGAATERPRGGIKILAGLVVGDFFDLYMPPYLLESDDGGVTFAPSTYGIDISNKEVAALVPGDSNLVCVCTVGNGLQCFG